MKKLFSVFCIVALVVSLFGCSNNSSENTASTTEQQNVTVEAVKPVITDYSLAGMMNVTDVYFSGKDSRGYNCRIGINGVDVATGITVYTICPNCDEESFAIVEFSEIPENLIGQQTFTWTGEESCANCTYNRPSFDIKPDYKYAIIFTLNS